LHSSSTQPWTGKGSGEFGSEGRQPPLTKTVPTPGAAFMPVPVVSVVKSLPVRDLAGG
jgi:hypothetical protein